MPISTRHTAEMVNARLTERQITLVGGYVNALTKTTFRCHLGHEWEATPNNVLRGKGCPHCAKRVAYTLSSFNEQISGRDIEMVTEPQKSRSLFRHLVCGTEWNSTISSVLRGSGCPSCAGNTKMSMDDINDKIRHRGVTMIEDRHSDTSRSLFRCIYGHEWHALIGNITAGKGCPSCAKYGFDPTKPAWEYAFTRDGYLKFGITNDLARRLNEHRKHGEIEVVHERYHEVGQAALDWESGIKRTHGGRYATKEQCPDGYTETLPLSRLQALMG